MTKIVQVTRGELFVSYLLSIDLSNEAKFMLPAGGGNETEQYQPRNTAYLSQLAPKGRGDVVKSVTKVYLLN